MATKTTKKIHWAKTPEGKRKLRRIALKRWREKSDWKNRNHATVAPKKTAKKAKKAKKSAVTFVGGAFLKKALDEAAASVTDRVQSAVTETLAQMVKPTIATPPPYQWTTANGDKIDVTMMEEGHLRNSISFCARRLVTKLSASVWLADTMSFVEGLSELLKEAKRRNLRV